MGTAPNPHNDPALASWFKVEISAPDVKALGTFSTCEGIGCEIVTEEREEGGNNDYVQRFPVRVKYPNVKLGRVLDHQSELIAKWIATMPEHCIPRVHLTITACRGDGSTVVTWVLRDAMPVRWQGPSFSAENAKVAMETLEIAHNGYVSS
jgi:phage tail-like protein